MMEILILLLVICIIVMACLISAKKEELQELHNFTNNLDQRIRHLTRDLYWLCEENAQDKKDLEQLKKELNQIKQQTRRLL